jgi:hypothetical protein
VSGTQGSTPETLVRVAQRLVAVSLGDPTPARVVELYVLGRLARSPTALHGSATRTLPDDILAAPVLFVAPGPFSGEWSRGARGLLGGALALGIGVWPDGDNLRIQAVLSGDWTPDDAVRLSSAWSDLAESSIGRLLGLDQSGATPEVGVSTTRLTFRHRVLLSPLASGLRAAVAADVWEFLEPPPARKGVPAGTDVPHEQH